MSEQQSQEEHIETHNNRRFKMRGSRITATLETCSHCKQLYWQPVVMVGADPVSLSHNCRPQAMGGASVINKFG